jgi:Flp pilus assembly protein TadG
VTGNPPRGGMSAGRDAESGAVLVEFALTLPLLLVLVAGMFDFGLAFQKMLVVTNAAREGARMAMLPGYATADVQDRVAKYLTAGGAVGTPTTTVTDSTITPGTGAQFATKVVTVSLDHSFLMLQPIAALVGGTFSKVTLKASSEMRVEVAAGGS